jgi:hypothetical protein
MNIHKGDRVLVNLAPFIGSVLPCDESVPCEVLEVEGIQVHVRAEPPYRAAALWVLSSWIEGRSDRERQWAAAIAAAD